MTAYAEYWLSRLRRKWSCSLGPARLQERLLGLTVCGEWHEKWHRSVLVTCPCQASPKERGIFASWSLTRQNGCRPKQKIGGRKGRR